MPNQPLQINQLTAAPGQKLYGIAELQIDNHPYQLPLWLINGDAPGPTLVVTGGVHGAEYASVAAALHLGQTLSPAGLRGRVIVVPVVNIPGFAARSIYVCPLDGKNPNRVFPGDPDGSASQQLAHWLFRNVISLADFYVDMHGGDLIEELVPFTIFFRSGNPHVDAQSLQLAQVFGIPYLVPSVNPGSTIAAASAAGIPAILTESGAQGIWTPQQVADHTLGLQRLMLHLNMLPGPTPQPMPTTLLEDFIWLRSEHEGFWYPQTSAGATVHAGQTLGHIKDWQGNILQTATTPNPGTVLFLVSSLAIHPNDPLFAVGA